jgi:serine/threonine-protein kinase
MKLAPGLVIAGRYRLEKRLAIGGMGSLWVARHAQLDVEVAIKFIDPKQAQSPVARQRFEREAKASATLRNAHVVHVQDYGIDGDLPYIVMELLHGEDLGRRLDREKRLPLPVVARILHQAAKGLRRAHEAGVVHRDLKPANVFLARADDDEEVVKILDFGIAKETGAVLVGEGTKTGELMGSPHYMSPEQVRGSKDLDHRSDLWSLGVILFRAVTGKLPFASQVLGAVIAHILADPIPRPTEIAPDLPAALDPFFARAFARDKTQRFQSAREMADTFTALVQSVTGGAVPRLDSMSDAASSSSTWTPPPRGTVRMPPPPPTPPSLPRPVPPMPPRPPLSSRPAPPNTPPSTLVMKPAAPPPLPRVAAPASPPPPPPPGIDITFDPVAEPSKPTLVSLGVAEPAPSSSAPSSSAPSSGAPSSGAPSSGAITAAEPGPTSGGLGGTGGPLVRTTPIPSWAPRSPSAAGWGVGISVLLGVGFVVLFLVMKGGGASHDETAPSSGAELASAKPEVSAASSPPLVPAPSPADSAAALAAAAAAAARAARTDPPKAATPAPKASDPGQKKKKPSWGF